MTDLDEKPDPALRVPDLAELPADELRALYRGEAPFGTDRLHAEYRRRLLDVLTETEGPEQR